MNWRTILVGVLGCVIGASTVGCGGASDSLGGQQSDETESKTATLSFTEDFEVDQSAPLVEGRKVRIEYDADRLPDCRGESNGQPAWTISAFYSLNGGDAESVNVAGFSPDGGHTKPVVTLPESGDLAIWFEVTNRWGCSAYDSDYGKNYHFDVASNGDDDSDSTHSQ